MEKNASKSDNLFSEFRPTRAAKQRPPAVYPNPLNAHTVIFSPKLRHFSFFLV